MRVYLSVGLSVYVCPVILAFLSCYYEKTNLKGFLPIKPCSPKSITAIAP